MRLSSVVGALSLTLLLSRELDESTSSPSSSAFDDDTFEQTPVPSTFDDATYEPTLDETTTTSEPSVEPTINPSRRTTQAPSRRPSPRPSPRPTPPPTTRRCHPEEPNGTAYDCGGICRPCEHGEKCLHADDCVGELLFCAAEDGVCHVLILTSPPTPCLEEGDCGGKSKRSKSPVALAAIMMLIASVIFAVLVVRCLSNVDEDPRAGIDQSPWQIGEEDIELTQLPQVDPDDTYPKDEDDSSDEEEAETKRYNGSASQFV